MMLPTQSRAKAEERARLEDDVAAFLQAGGEITNHDHTDNKFHRDRLTKRKRIGSRGLPPGHSSTALPDSPNVNKQNPGATPDHTWRGGYRYATGVTI